MQRWFVHQAWIREDYLKESTHRWDITSRVVFPCSGFPDARVQRWAHLYEHTVHVGFCTRAKQKERRARTEREAKKVASRGWGGGRWAGGSRTQGRAGGKERRVYIGRSGSGWTAVGENRDSNWEREKIPAKKSPVRRGQRDGKERRGTAESERW